VAEEEILLPPLFKVYLDMGAKVCSEPAIDRELGVVDFLIVLDVEKLDDRTRKRMFGKAQNGPGALEKASQRPSTRADYKH